METKHTPGPWWYDTYNTVFSGSVPANNMLEICSIPDEPETGESPCPTRDKWYPESAANARLIAAAPDLLEALKMILDDPIAPISTLSMQHAKSVIAKAEGRQA